MTKTTVALQRAMDDYNSILSVEDLRARRITAADYREIGITLFTLTNNGCAAFLQPGVAEYFRQHGLFVTDRSGFYVVINGAGIVRGA